MKLQSKIQSMLFFSLAVALTVTPAWQRSYAQQHKAVNLSSANNLPFSDGIVAGNTLYIAGQQGLDASGKLVPGGIGPETKATLETIEKVVKKAGFELKDIVSVNVYLADINEFGDMNNVYKAFLPNPKPSRTTIQAAALVNHARIEISAIAVKQK
ncbi:MAG TPA: RidA family protein [Terriglobales bacterium]|jgi:2-iminobutanoate/2-iminopropanoate deaminase